MTPRNKLLLIAALCAAPVVLASAAYLLGWGAGSTGNYGELLAPQAISAPPLAALRGKWVLVSFDAAACDAYCERKLYFMRQVRRATGKEMARVERLWVLTDGGKPRPDLLTAIEGTRLSSEPVDFPGNRTDHIYLVDPLGNLMLRFPRDPDPSRMLKDLQRLLRVSQVG